VKREQRGAVAVLMLAVVVVAGLVVLGLARAGAAAARSARADTAADAAALAAAAALARSEGSAASVVAARTAAADDGAVLWRCDCVGTHAEVVVRVDDATARARAEVDRACGLVGLGCRATPAGDAAGQSGRSSNRSTVRAAALSRYSFQLPHFGDWTHDGHPARHGHSSTSARVART